MPRYARWASGLVLLAGLALAADVQRGKPTNASMPVGGTNHLGKVFPLSVDDGGVLSVSVTGGSISVTVSPLTKVVGADGGAVLVQGSVIPISADGGSALVLVVGLDGGAVSVQGTVGITGNVISVSADGGAVYVQRAPGAWDCAADPIGYCTSSGPTVDGTILTVPAGGYIKGQCNVATYVGGTSAYDAVDGGGVPVCYQTDAGINPACWLQGANEKFYFDLRGTARNSVACLSVTGAASCSISSCGN